MNVSSGGDKDNGSSPYVNSLSADGRFVVFNSRGTNLVQGDTNNTRDWFVHDRRTAQTGRSQCGHPGRRGQWVWVFRELVDLARRALCYLLVLR